MLCDEIKLASRTLWFQLIALRVHSYPAVDVLTVFDNSCGLNDLDFRNVNSEAAAL